jgi:hypothetical protein
MKVVNLLFPVFLSFLFCIQVTDIKISATEVKITTKRRSICGGISGEILQCLNGFG